MKLVIFDLDQTLVDFLPLHEETVHRLFLEKFNIDVQLTGIDFSGRSLSDNIVELAAANGIAREATTARMEDLLGSYERIFSSLMPSDPQKYILPGVPELLQGLTEAGHFIVLYTGDSRVIANMVLSAAGLDKYFRFAVYGTEFKSRLDMARAAVRKAEDMTHSKFSDENVVIAGDSLRDVECGRQLPALTVAVATGVHSVADLKNKGADYVFNNLADTAKVIEAIENLHTANVPLETGKYQP